MTSVIFPCKNDLVLLREVIDNLTDGLDESTFEIIVINDGSTHTNGQLLTMSEKDFNHSNVRVINNGATFGVGYSFDRGAESATGDIIVLCGSDIFPRKVSWLSDVQRYVREDEIGCCASVGLNGAERNLNHEKRYVRYGANLLYTVSNNDLPRNSFWRNKKGGYTVLFEGKWQGKLSDKPYEIPCLMGAFYFTTKKFYDKIHGWDTEESVRYQGHQGWGSLEPYISLKTKIYGGKLRVYPDFEVGHIFGRVTGENISRSVREDLHWFNRLFMVHTMTDSPLKEELLAFPHPEYPLNIAQKVLGENWGKVEKVRNRNLWESKGLVTEKPY